MKLLFKQRFFSWFDSYDIYDEYGQVAYTVKGQLAWGHTLNIFDCTGRHIATLKEQVLTFMPKFEILINNQYVGEIKEEFTFFKPSFTVDCGGWRVEGDFWEWDYRILSGPSVIATIQKQLFNWTDTYVIDVENPNDSLLALMVVLAIDAVKCGKND